MWLLTYMCTVKRLELRSTFRSEAIYVGYPVFRTTYEPLRHHPMQTERSPRGTGIHLQAPGGNSNSTISSTIPVAGDSENDGHNIRGAATAARLGEAEWCPVRRSDAEGGRARHRPRTPGRARSHTPAESTIPPTAPEPAPVRSRRPRQRNWESAEMVTLIKAKAAEHHAVGNIVDTRSQMVTTQQKWTRVSRAIMAERVLPHERDDSSCMI
jgi:hypothetical protein